MNSDHVWHFIGSLHFSPLLRLMGCLAINEHAKTWTGPRSGKGYIHRNTHTHTRIYTRTVPISSRMSELGPRKGHYFRYMEAYKHRRKIYTCKRTHAGTTLSVTSSSVYCGSVTCMLLTSSSFVFYIFIFQRKLVLFLNVIL